MKSKLILLTGATGYLGSRLLQELLKSDFRVQAITRTQSRMPKALQIRSHDLLAPLIWNFHAQKPANEMHLAGPIHSIIHCAADYGHGASYEQVHKANFDFATQIFTWGEKLGMKNFVNAGTSLPPEVNAYAETKSRFVDFLRKQTSTQTIHLVLENFFGPEDSPKKFVTWLIRELLSERVRIPLTAGEQIRNFIPIDDVVSAFISALKLPYQVGFQQWHVRSLESMSIRTLTELVCDLCEKNRQVLGFGDLAYRSHEPLFVRNDIPQFPIEIWQGRTKISEALKATIADEKLRRKNL